MAAQQEFYLERAAEARASAAAATLEKEQRLSYELENGKGGKSSAVNLQSA